jgi:DNA-binding MarR family transcriptional regulator
MTDVNLLVTNLQEAFSIIRRRMMGNMFAFARDKGLTMGQFGAMFHISRKGGCGVSDIGNDLGVTNSAASQMLDRLVQYELINRSEDPSDRRGKLISLTNKGRQILQEGNLANRIWLEELARSMNPDEQEQVNKAILIIIDKARELETTSEKASV